MSKITEALLKLDVQNNNHWTADGLPRLDTVKMLAADQSLTREVIAAALPGFLRNNATTYVPDQAPAETSPDTGNAAQVTEAPAALEAPLDLDQAIAVMDKAIAVMDAQAEVDPIPETIAESEPVSLQLQLQKQEALVREIREYKARVDAEFEKARLAEDDLRNKLEKLTTVDTTVDAIQGYLASQRKLLEQRAARQQLIRESGINLKELVDNLKAPIDSVMSRRKTRGNQRPGS